jgi:hypothetical protein
MKRDCIVANIGGVGLAFCTKTAIRCVLLGFGNQENRCGYTVPHFHATLAQIDKDDIKTTMTLKIQEL